MIKHPPARNLTAKQLKEIEVAKRYLGDAQAECDGYHTKTDLIGRALTDLRDRAQQILDKAVVGIPFFEVNNGQKHACKRSSIRT